MSDNLSELLSRKGLEKGLFGKLREAAESEGAPDNENIEKLADEFLIGKANVYGTTTFYDFLKPENKDKKIYVCNGTACLCANTQSAVIARLEDKFESHEIGHMTCLGRCHENSAFHYKGKNYSGAAIDSLSEIVDNKAHAHPDHYHVGSYGPEILTAPFSNIQTYYSPFLEALKKDPQELLEEIKLSNLRGRGGAGFPMGLKLEFCRRAEGTTRFIICNADEGDPGAYSDRYLLEQRPHSVLFGMLISGYVAGAGHGIVYIRAEYPEAVTIVEDAINELRENGLLGKDIVGSGFDFDLKVIKAQGSYICGEETALINSIEGQRPEVRVRPPFPAQKGLFNKPTTVNNVETLAALHYIVSNGGQAWKSVGTERSSGTKLVCLDSLFANPGLYEVEMGTPFRTVVYDLGGGFKKPVKALQVGGPLGGLVPIKKIEELTLDFESFSNNGFLLGHASVVSVPEDLPMIRFIEHLFDFAAYESCGKCFPCRLGTKRGFELAKKAQDDNYKIDRRLFDDLLETLEKGSLCAHGGGIPLPVRNALKYFNDELEPYFN